jgi:hypothetical protein
MSDAIAPLSYCCAILCGIASVLVFVWTPAGSMALLLSASLWLGLAAYAGSGR